MTDTPKPSTFEELIQELADAVVSSIQRHPLIVAVHIEAKHLTAAKALVSAYKELEAELERTKGPALTETLTHTRSCGYWDSERGCECALAERIQVQTWQNLHNAWRKRAEEAESRIAELEANALTAEETKAALFFVNGHEGDWPDEKVEFAMREKLRRSISSKRDQG